MPPRKVPVRKAVAPATSAPVASTSKAAVPPARSQPKPSTTPAKHAVAEDDNAEIARQEGLVEWEEMCRPNWKGLGLMDPIKNVEVSRIVPTNQRSFNCPIVRRINGSYYPPSSR
jgi:hypothetical protein